MRTVFQACQPRPEVLAGELRKELFAARLRDVIERRADPVYKTPSAFFDNTYPTEGLRVLLDEALGRVTGEKPDKSAVIRLETAFGGGKTHNLIALYHVAQGHNPGPDFVDAELVPDPGSVQVVGIVGSDLQPSDGLDHGDVVTYTLWGELAYQIGGRDGYVVARSSDEDRSAPGTGILEKLVGSRPTLIMLDEVARHLRAAQTVPTATGKSDLAEQTVAFLMSLFEFAASQEQVCVILTLAGRRDAFGKETEELRQELLNEAQRVSAQQERVITPTGETEIPAIVAHRLFQSIDREAAREAAYEYTQAYRRWTERGANLPMRALRADYAGEIIADYPFHPELLNTLTRKTATIPNFQKTRGRGRGAPKASDMAERDYERTMTAAFREMHRVLRDDGVLTVMFTHKQVEAWDTLATALIGAGFSIESSWPVHTESRHSLHQAKKNAARSTILLACRKRSVSEEPVWWDDIQGEVRQAARERATEFSE